MFKELSLGAIAIILLIMLIVGGSFASLWHYGYFAPKYKAVERKVWEESPSRVEGAIQEISKRNIEYQSASQDEKVAICNYLRNSYPDISQDDIQDNRLWQFFSNCKYGVYN